MNSPEPVTSVRRHLNLDDSPIKPAIDGQRIKSFEEFLNLSLQNDQPDENVDDDQVSSIPKKPFLRKGTGLSRYKPPPGSPRKTRLCQSNGCVQQKQRFVRSVSSGSSAAASVQILPRTTSRFSTAARSAVSVSRKDVPFNPALKANAPSKSKSERCVQTSSSLENLEGLLRTVRGRKEEVIRQLVKSDESSSSSEWEEDDYDQSGDEGDEVLLDFKESNLVKPRKKVRWVKKTKAAKLLSGRSKLTKPTPGPYSLHLAHSIHELENKLHHLQARCSRVSSPPQKVIVESEVIDETIALKKEVLNLNDKIKNLTNELKTLQLMTGNSVNRKNKQSLEKRTKVTVHRNPALAAQTTISRDISVPRHKDESVIYFENGCTMQRFKDDTIIFTYKNGTKQTTLPDGTKLVEFPNNQIERTLPNGVKHITYPNRNYRIIFPDGSEELTTTDGTILRIGPDGTEMVILPDGEREIRTREYTRHEYRNGIMKTVYADGTQETRYPNGRLRIKDRFDNIVVDSMLRTLDQLS